VRASGMDHDPQGGAVRPYRAGPAGRHPGGLHPMSKKIRLAVAGVGHCACSLVQGIEYSRNADPTDTVPGLMPVSLGGYHVGDVEFVAAFDVDAAKVGLDLGKAVFSGQNNTIRFISVGEMGVEVQRGPTLAGLAK